MKELKMFPQITEETEENLLNLEEVDEHPSKTENSVKSITPPAEIMPPNEENHSPCEVPKIVTEDVDMNSVDEVFASPPPRTRMRSLSGGAYRLTPVPAAGRMRRQSGDDVLSGISPSRRAAIFDAFRPRSKSESKGKRPTFLTTLKNSVQQTFMAAAFPSSATNSTPKQLEPDFLDPLVGHGDNRHRPRSGSETKSGPMSKMIEMFRNRSNSLSIDLRNKRPITGPPSITASALLRRYSVDPDKRKASTNYHRSLDGYLEEQSAHYSSDSEDLKDHNTGEESKSNLTFEDIENENMILPRFFDYHQCYSLIPLSAKLVVLDTQLPVKKAFFSLLKNSIRAAPLWENRTFQFIGMLTITDFINILRTYYNAADENMEQLEDQRIEAWRNMLKMNERPFISIDPDKSLTEAIKTLVYQKVHRLPVVQPETTNVLYIITHKRILKFLSLHFSEIPLPSFLEKTIKELKIGTYENIATATPETTVIEALNLFVERGVSALPVVENDQVVNIYAKFDVFALAEKNTYGDLDISIRIALEHRSESFEGVHTCTLDNTLRSVIQMIIEAGVHRLVVVDKGNKVIGMISLSDILKFLVLRPLGLEQIQLEQLQPVQTVPEEKEQTNAASLEHAIIQEPALPESREENLLQLSESED